MNRLVIAIAVVLGGCGGHGGGDDSGVIDDLGGIPPDAAAFCAGVDCSGHGTCFPVDGAPVCQCDGGYVRTDPLTCVPSTSPTLGGCPIFPADHIFNTPIDALPVHPDSDAFIATIGNGINVHLDLGTQTDQQADDFYGIPYNLVHGDSFAWPQVSFLSTDPDLDWNPEDESDCAAGSAHTFTQPCTIAAPLLPIPASPIVEGGINTAADQQPYGDHHILMVDVDTCMLWETYHSYSNGGWNIFGSAGWDLNSDALRPADWSSADAAGFPITALLLREDEAASGEIRHALRFTIDSDHIRTEYVWPARHLTNNGTGDAALPPMGQLFRLKASYVIPAGASTQSRAIMQALKTYGMYLADGGSPMYITGEPSAAWDDTIFDEVQNLTSDDFEAVDLSPIMNAQGWDANSAAVP